MKNKRTAKFYRPSKTLTSKITLFDYTSKYISNSNGVGRKAAGLISFVVL